MIRESIKDGIKIQITPIILNLPKKNRRKIQRNNKGKEGLFNEAERWEKEYNLLKETQANEESNLDTIKIE